MTARDSSKAPTRSGDRICKWCGKPYPRTLYSHQFKCREKTLHHERDERNADLAIDEWKRLETRGQTQNNKYSHCPHELEPWFHDDCSVCLSRVLPALGKAIATVARSDLMSVARHGHQLQVEIAEGVGFTSSYWWDREETCITFRSWKPGETRRVATIKGPCEDTAAKVLNRLLKLAAKARGRTHHR